jgi:hypothetical protein
MVAQLILVQFVLVQIQVGQPACKALDLNGLSAFFVALNPEPLLTKKGMMLTYVSKH